GGRVRGGGGARPGGVEPRGVALRALRAPPRAAPDGLIELDGDWFYLELGRELSLDRIGLPPATEAGDSETATDLLALQPPTTAFSP
ncbi:MAG: hypothetical protein ACK4F7_04030, partial [Inhella sp.]